MKKILFFSIATTLIFSSCEDILTKNLELEEIAFEKQIAISGSLDSSADEFSVLVSENQSITDPFDEWEALSDAIVSLYQDEVLLGELSFEETSVQPEEAFENGKGLFVLDLENLNIEPNDYRIEVSHPDFPDASATSTLPSEIAIDNIVFEADFGIAPNFLERTDAVHISFTDPPGDNYYNFNIVSDTIGMDTFIFEMDTFIFEQFYYISIDSNEPNVQFTNNGVLFSDDFFDGEEHTITFYVTDFSPEGISEFRNELDIEWEVMSEEKFRFKESFNLYQDSQGFGPFSEAVSIYNNIEGGVGVFSTTNKSFYPIP